MIGFLRLRVLRARVFFGAAFVFTRAFFMAAS
jgi:hypothetical protein